MVLIKPNEPRTRGMAHFRGLEAPKRTHSVCHACMRKQDYYLLPPVCGVTTIRVAVVYTGRDRRVDVKRRVLRPIRADHDGV